MLFDSLTMNHALWFSQCDHLTQTAPNMSHFLFGTKFALFGYAYKQLPWKDYRYFFWVELGCNCTSLNQSEKVILGNIFWECVNAVLSSDSKCISFLLFITTMPTIHRWSYGIVLYEIFTIGRLFDICSIQCPDLFHWRHWSYLIVVIFASKQSDASWAHK